MKLDLARKGVVYRATTPNGKVYIGITLMPLRRRIQAHFGDARNGSRRTFARALRKYGPDVRFEVIETAETWAALCELEKRHIAAHRSAESRYGYNRTDGGEGRSYTSPDEIRRQSLCQKKRFSRPEEREDAARAKGAKPFLVFHGAKLVGEWLAIQGCARDLGVPATKICASLKGRRNGAAGYTFRYAEESDRGARPLPKGAKVDWARRFFVYRDGRPVGEYTSQALCAGELGLSQGHISSCLKGHRSVHGGYSFRYASEREDVSLPTEADRRRQRALRQVRSKGGRLFLAFRNTDVVGEYLLKAECARELGLSASGISACLSGKIESTGGHVFVYSDEAEMKPPPSDAERRKKRQIGISTSHGGRLFEVYRDDVMVGEFQVQSECAKVLGLSQGNIGMCLKGVRPGTKGFTFKFKDGEPMDRATSAFRGKSVQGRPRGPFAGPFG